jgi:hypothetical protein
MEVRNHMEVSGDGGGTKFIESGVGRANGYRRDISTNGRCIRLGVVVRSGWDAPQEQRQKRRGALALKTSAIHQCGPKRIGANGNDSSEGHQIEGGFMKPSKEGTKFIESGVGRANGYRRDTTTNGRCIGSEHKQRATGNDHQSSTKYAIGVGGGGGGRNPTGLRKTTTLGSGTGSSKAYTGSGLGKHFAPMASQQNPTTMAAAMKGMARSAKRPK